jgi:hypothetical protein
MILEKIPMKTSRFSDARIMAILKQAEDGIPVAQLCREHGMSDAIFTNGVRGLAAWMPRWSRKLRAWKKRTGD